MGISLRVLAASASRPEFSSALVRSISSTARTMAPIKVGDAIPSVDLFEGTPGNKVNLAEECKSGKHVIMGVPGAFTPTCSKTHLPGYVAKAGRHRSHLLSGRQHLGIKQTLHQEYEFALFSTAVAHFQQIELIFRV